MSRYFCRSPKSGFCKEIYTLQKPKEGTLSTTPVYKKKSSLDPTYRSWLKLTSFNDGSVRQGRGARSCGSFGSFSISGGARVAIAKGLLVKQNLAKPSKTTRILRNVGVSMVFFAYKVCFLYCSLLLKGCFLRLYGSTEVPKSRFGRDSFKGSYKILK